MRMCMYMCMYNIYIYICMYLPPVENMLDKSFLGFIQLAFTSDNHWKHPAAEPVRPRFQAGQTDAASACHWGFMKGVVWGGVGFTWDMLRRYLQRYLQITSEYLECFLEAFWRLRCLVQGTGEGKLLQETHWFCPRLLGWPIILPLSQFWELSFELREHLWTI
jgi:hypothetical protein